MFVAAYKTLSNKESNADSNYLWVCVRMYVFVRACIYVYVCLCLKKNKRVRLWKHFIHNLIINASIILQTHVKYNHVLIFNMKQQNAYFHF